MPPGGTAPCLEYWSTSPGLLHMEATGGGRGSRANWAASHRAASHSLVGAQLERQLALPAVPGPRMEHRACDPGPHP
eukprot:4750027-Pyramimonas_sp.AAC.1